MADEGFDARKAAVLAALASVERDKSLKGGLDAPIADLVAEINGHDDLFTTSSCSGRISLLLEPHDAAAAAAVAGGAGAAAAGTEIRGGGGEGVAADSAGAAKRVKKKARGGEWLLVSHDPIDPADLVTAVFSTSTARTDADVCNSASSTITPPATCASPPALPGELVFRFEPLILALECRSLASAQALPLILALECRTLAAAQALVSCAIRAGFRESGEGFELGGLGFGGVLGDALTTLALARSFPLFPLILPLSRPIPPPPPPGITSVSAKRIIVAVRCSIRLEAPLTAGGMPLVGDAYVRQLAAVANGKMALNRERTERFRARFNEEVRVGGGGVGGDCGWGRLVQPSGRRWPTARWRSTTSAPTGFECGSRRSCSLLSHPPPQPSQPQPTPLNPTRSPHAKPKSHPRKAARRSSKGQQEAANGQLAQQQGSQVAQRQVAVLRRVGEVERWLLELLRGGVVGEAPLCTALTAPEPASAGASGHPELAGAGGGAGMAPYPLQDVAGGCCSSAWDMPRRSQASEELAHGSKAQDGQLHGQVVKVLRLPEGSLLRWGHSAVTVAASRAMVGAVGAGGKAEKESAGAGTTNLGSTGAGTTEAGKARGEAAGTAVVVFGGFGGSGVHSRRGDVVVVTMRERGEEGGRGSEEEKEEDVVVEGSVVETRGSGPSARMWHSATVVRVGRGRDVVRGSGGQAKGAESNEASERGEKEEEEGEGEEGEEEMVVIGGRHGPNAALADVFSLNLRTMTWRHVAAPEAPSGEVTAATATTATTPALPEATAAISGTDATAVTAATGVPLARYRHAAAALGSSVFVFGGTSHPHAPPLTSLQVFSTRSFSWLPDPVASGQMPAPRHSHAMATVGNQVYLFGGRDSQRVFSDLFFFEVVSSDPAVGGCEAPRNPQMELAASSSNSSNNSNISNSSGMNVNRLHVRWTKVWDSAPVAIPERFSHSLTTYGQHLLIFGGCPHSRAGPEIVLVNTASNEVSRIPVALPLAALPVRHTASVVKGGSLAGGGAIGGSTVGDRLLVLGGGAACFAFGSVFSPPFSIPLKGILQGKIGYASHQRQGQQQQQQEQQQERQEQLAQDRDLVRQSQGGLGWVLLVPRREGKRWKDVLQTHGALDKTRKPATVNPDVNPEVSHVSARRSSAAGDGGELLLALPVCESAVSTVAAMDGVCMTPQTVSVPAAPVSTAVSGPAQEQQPTAVEAVAADLGGMSATASNTAASQSAAAAAVLTQLHLTPSPARPLTPFQRLHHAIHSLLHLKAKQLNSSENSQPTATHLSLLSHLPARWERLGDMVVLPADAMLGEAWDRLGPELWQVVAEALGAARVARQGRLLGNSHCSCFNQHLSLLFVLFLWCPFLSHTGLMQAPVAPRLTRDSQLQLLLGSSSWVEHRENGITYTFDAARCMFSSGNGTEKQRMAALRLHDREVVVDLFAGIGYFTIPLLVHSRARHVFACEWNPAAVHGLRSSLAANQVSPDRYTVLEGDNRVVAPVGVADRVLLGLIPSSEASWRTAIRCLKPREGGVAHVHGNAVDVEEQQWTDYVVGEFEKLAREEGRSWEVNAMHLERVKWYAPHIRHVVLDVCCKPSLVDGAELLIQCSQ
ncbi:unnamed protein product [Closterium sp. NIES-54]